MAHYSRKAPFYGAFLFTVSESRGPISLAKKCKFRDCTHTNEPGCAILEAVENGSLDRRRLDSYLKLANETEYDGLSSKEIEVKKFERLFKDAGGMKNARRFAKEYKKRK